MSSITVEHSLDQKILSEIGVYSWPIWTKGVSCFPWHYDEKEIAYLLAGEVVVTPDNGEAPVTIKAADLVTFAAGLSCHGDIKQDLRKHYQLD